MDNFALLIIRVTIAGLFLYPVKDLIRDWDNSVEMVKLVIPMQPQLFTYLMIVVMIFGAISLLFGVYAQFGALLLFLYSIIGIIVHYKLSYQIQDMQLSKTASKKDLETLNNTKNLGIVGNTTSAQKNIIIAAALLQIILVGPGSFSLF